MDKTITPEQVAETRAELLETMLELGLKPGQAEVLVFPADTPINSLTPEQVEAHYTKGVNSLPIEDVATLGLFVAVMGLKATVTGDLLVAQTFAIAARAITARLRAEQN